MVEKNTGIKVNKIGLQDTTKNNMDLSLVRGNIKETQLQERNESDKYDLNVSYSLPITINTGKGLLKNNNQIQPNTESQSIIRTGDWSGSWKNTTVSYKDDNGYDFSASPNSVYYSAVVTLEGVNLASKTPIVGPVWWSHYINDNNDNYNKETGETEKRGQPGFETGDKNPYDPSVGIGTESCRGGKICGPLLSDQGWLKYLDDDVYGFSDFSAFHDNHMSKVENAMGEKTSIPVKVVSIPAYLVIYYYGATGTYLEKGINYLRGQNSNSQSVVIRK